MSGLAGRWRALSPVTRGLCIVVLAGALGLNVLLYVLPRDDRMVALGYTVALFTFYADDDSWDPMRSALHYLDENNDTPLYHALLLEKGAKFQYPPTSLLVAEPLIRTRYGGPPEYRLLNGISLVAVLATIALSVVMFERSAPPPTSSFDGRLRIAALAALGLTFYPLTRAFVLGQIQTWLDLGVAALLFAWCAGKERVAGVVAGLMAVIKPHYGLVLVWALLRKRWSVLVAGLLTVAALGAASIARYGLANHIDYLWALSFMARVGESYYPNQSVNGLVNRMLFIGNNLDWRAHDYPPFHPAVYIATVVASIVLLGTAMFWRSRAPDRGGVTDLMILLLSTTMASSIAWEHHYGIMLPMFALVTPALLRLRPCGRWTLGLLVVAYELVSLRLSITNVAAATHWNFLQSYVLAGALLFLVLLYRLRVREAEADVSVSLARSQR